MSSLTLDELPDLERHYRVGQLLAQYVHCIDEDRLEAWPEFFVDDCVYRIVARENVSRDMPLAAIYCDSKGMLADRIVSLRHANIYEAHRYRHIVSSTVLSEVTATSLRALSNYAVYRTRTNGETELYSAGMYDDRIVSVDGALKFREKTVIYDTSRIDTQLVTPL